MANIKFDREKCINKVVEMIQHYLKGNNSITFEVKSVDRTPAINDAIKLEESSTDMFNELEDESNKLGMHIDADLKQQSLDLFEKDNTDNKEIRNVSRKEIIDVVKCSNPNCISNSNEPIQDKFYVQEKEPVILRCHYCERTMDYEDIESQF